MNRKIGWDLATLLANGNEDDVVDFHYQRPHAVTAQVIRDGVRYTMTLVEDPTQPDAHNAAATAPKKRGRRKPDDESTVGPGTAPEDPAQAPAATEETAG